VSRYHDNRHHVSDIIGGFVLAALVGMPCFISWAGQLHWFAARLEALAQKEAGMAQHELLSGMSGTSPNGGKLKPAQADIEQGKAVEDVALPKVALEGHAGSLTHASGSVLAPNGSAVSAGSRH
jgi:uncharacterized iron-regulated membrane protein